jgi:putative peptidoglycan lipid II flippase
VAALLLMSGTLWLAMGAESSWLLDRAWIRVGRLALLVVLGAGVYLGSLWLLGFRLRDFVKKTS